MNTIRNDWEFEDDFIGDLVFHPTKASNVGHRYTFTRTAAAGTPVPTSVATGINGEIAIAFSSNSEIQNLCLSLGDKLQLDLARLQNFHARVKLNQASLGATNQFAIGVASARNDAIDSIAVHALFRLIGSGAWFCETDDGVIDLDDKPTGKSASQSYSDLRIDLSNKKDVRFFIDGQPVCRDVTFDMSNHSGGLQFYAQLQKTADANTEGVTLDYWGANGVRRLGAAI